jgi:hypothetical protein
MAVMPLRLARAVRGVRRNLPYKSQTASSDGVVPSPYPVALVRRHGEAEARASDRAGGAHSFGGLRAVLDLIGRAGRKEQRGIELGASRVVAPPFSIESGLWCHLTDTPAWCHQLSLWR